MYKVWSEDTAGLGKEEDQKRWRSTLIRSYRCKGSKQKANPHPPIAQMEKLRYGFSPRDWEELGGRGRPAVQMG
jgi:hypothetical protein